MRQALFLALVVTVFPLASALATHPGTTHTYSVVGFTANGKYVYFAKQVDDVTTQTKWLAVYEVATGKRVTSKPVYRDCDEPGEDCYGVRAISRKSGEKTAATLHDKYGAPTAGTKLKSTSHSTLDGKKTDSKQTFETGSIKLQVLSRLRGELEDPNETGNATASFSLELFVTAGEHKLSGKRKVRAEPIEDEDNGNILLWPELYVQEIVLAPNSSAAALVFGSRPFVVQLRQQ